jgi:hypothetical protein
VLAPKPSFRHPLASLGKTRALCSFINEYMKRLLILVVCTAALKAQSIAVTSPPSGTPAWSGYSGNQFQASLTSAPNISQVCYTVDSYPATNPGSTGIAQQAGGALAAVGCSLMSQSPFTFPVNSFWWLNGPHQVVATGYDSKGNIVATSSPVQFTTANTWPQSWNPSLAITTGTSLTSSWSGYSASTNISSTITGSGAANNSPIIYFIDGVAQSSIGVNGGASASYNIDTRQFADGVRNVCLHTNDSTDGWKSSDGATASGSTEWCRPITFSNGATPQELRMNAHELFLAPGGASGGDCGTMAIGSGSCTLTCTLVNANGTTSSPTCTYYSQNPSVCTVNASTGVVTAVATGGVGSPSLCIVRAMAEEVSGTDLVITSCCSNNGSSATSASHPFAPQNAFGGGKNGGWVFQVTGGTNFNPGYYESTGFWVFESQLGIGQGSTANGYVGTTNGLTGGSFTTGHSSTIYVYVWPTNVFAYVGTDQLIHTSYNASNAILLHTLRNSGPVCCTAPDAPYSPGFLADVNSFGFNAIEPNGGGTVSGINGNNCETSGQMSAWQTYQSGVVSSYTSIVSPSLYPRIYAYPDYEGFAWQAPNLYCTTHGPPASWSTPAFQYAVQSWTNTGRVLGAWMCDECPWGIRPLQGPLNFSSGAQSGLISIVASSGVCTATWNNGFSLNESNNFIISGSSVANMNSVAGSVYNSGSSFVFTCTGVPNGTYNASNDPGLAIEPYGVAWYNSNTDYIRYNAFETLMLQANAVTNHHQFAYPLIALAVASSCSGVQNWSSPNGPQSLGGIMGGGYYADLYNSSNAGDFINSRYPLFNDFDPGDADAIGSITRGKFGCWSPDLPLVLETQFIISGGGNDGYGQVPGVIVPITSMSGNTITLSAPSTLTTVYPGMTRVMVAGATSGNGNYYIYSAPTATTLTVAPNQTDFTASCSSSCGTLTFSNGDTYAVASVHATGTPPGGDCSLYPGATGALGSGCITGDLLTYGAGTNCASAPCTAFPRHRGQTFTLSTTGFTGKTFLYLPENITGISTATVVYREIPNLSATGGTATIYPDNNFVPGRNYYVTGAIKNPLYNYSTSLAAFILPHVWGERAYKNGYSTSVYTDANGTGGWWGNAGPAYGLNNVFGNSALDEPGQTFCVSHYENNNTVPCWHALSAVGIAVNRWQKYIMQPSLNSPDYGQEFQCAARTGSYGKIFYCGNFTDGVETRTFALTNYETSGQNIIRNVINWHGGNTITVISAGTPTDTLTLQPGDAVFYVFPITFTGELRQPHISVPLADVANATDVAVQYAYDPYWMGAAGASYDCGTGTCTLPVDSNVGTIYYVIQYLDTNGHVLATSAVQNL